VNNPVVIVKAEQTSLGFPSQWNAWDTEGRYYYMRYRRGHGTVLRCADPSPSAWTEEEWYNPVASFDYGDPLDGVIAFDVFCEQAGLALAPMIEYACFDRYLSGLVDSVLQAASEDHGTNTQEHTS
jgi:hypothetical protein